MYMLFTSAKSTDYDMRMRYTCTCARIFEDYYQVGGASKLDNNSIADRFGFAELSLPTKACLQEGGRLGWCYEYRGAQREGEAGSSSGPDG